MTRYVSGRRAPYPVAERLVPGVDRPLGLVQPHPERTQRPQTALTAVSRRSRSTAASTSRRVRSSK
ncbi:hypothetical protein [Streptomyces californicus]|uniref:hypothetical protein n=1 Tax=Streptomyces californicus TaxID=67351 RepID=UPI00368DDDE6